MKYVSVLIHSFVHSFSSIKAEGIYLQLLKGQILLFCLTPENTFMMPRRSRYLAAHIDVQSLGTGKHEPARDGMPS